MKRRQFMTLLGGAAAWPLTARAQQPAVPAIGYLNSESRDLSADRVVAFHQGLKETGYVEGQNLAIEYRWADGQYDRLPALVADLVRRQVTAIATNGPGLPAAKAATATIPIVFYSGFDPVQQGFVASLNRPGGNLTGVTSLNIEVEAKRLELLHELVPSVAVVAALINPTSPQAETVSRNMQTAARTLGLQLHILQASSERDFDTVFASLIQLRAGGLAIGTHPFFNSRSEQLAALASRYAVPVISPYREFVAAGGLISYGGSLADLDRLAGVYTGRILKGEKPADMPVQQATKIELVINLKAAKALGLTVALALLTRADEVIE
jgi:putative ABC transport system substrate-binding protein